MKRLLRAFAFAVFLLPMSSAFGAFHLFTIEQVFSNSDGTVQFILLVNGPNNRENLWAGQGITASGGGGTRTYAFATDLPTAATANKYVLIATQGFAALGILTPDYVVPNGFLSTTGGTINYAGVDQVTYASLPTDATHAITRNGVVVPNSPVNFAGASASVGGGPASFTPIGGVWWNPNESGSGYGLDFKDGVLLVQIYSYLAGGSAQWYLAAGAVTNNVFTATLDKYTGGQCISCAYKGPAIAGNDGSTTFTFTSPTTANVTLPGGRQIQIQRYFQPPSVGSAANSITPVGGVWWNPNESGSGYGIDYQDGVLLVQIYSYLAGGPAQWYLAAGGVTANTFTATLDKYTGGQCISCAYKGPTLAGNDGQTTFVFTSPTTATVMLPGERQIQIQRYFQ
ncbi:MAG: hypothetical protein ABI724_16575 [Betaproteobacteria bacterium]